MPAGSESVVSVAFPPTHRYRAAERRRAGLELDGPRGAGGDRRRQRHRGPHRLGAGRRELSEVVVAVSGSTVNDAVPVEPAYPLPGGRA